MLKIVFTCYSRANCQNLMGSTFFILHFFLFGCSDFLNSVSISQPRSADLGVRWVGCAQTRPEVSLDGVSKEFPETAFSTHVTTSGGVSQFALGRQLETQNLQVPTIGNSEVREIGVRLPVQSPVTFTKDVGQNCPENFKLILWIDEKVFDFCESNSSGQITMELLTLPDSNHGAGSVCVSGNFKVTNLSDLVASPSEIKFGN